MLIAGLDLGQTQDYTALAFVEAHGTWRELRLPPGTYGPEGHWDAPVTFDVRHLQRFALGTPYPQVVDEVARLVRDTEGASLVVDATGVGMAVVELLRLAGVTPIPLIITGGDAVTCDAASGVVRVPKRELVGVLQVGLQTRRLRIAQSLPQASVLVDEMLNFRARITPNAHDTYGAWRERSHDDLVLAVAIACWMATIAFTPPAEIPVVRDMRWGRWGLRGLSYPSC